MDRVTSQSRADCLRNVSRIFRPDHFADATKKKTEQILWQLPALDHRWRWQWNLNINVKMSWTVQLKNFKIWLLIEEIMIFQTAQSTSRSDRPVRRFAERSERHLLAKIGNYLASIQKVEKSRKMKWMIALERFLNGYSRFVNNRPEKFVCATNIWQRWSMADSGHLKINFLMNEPLSKLFTAFTWTWFVHFLLMRWNFI